MANGPSFCTTNGGTWAASTTGEAPAFVPDDAPCVLFGDLPDFRSCFKGAHLHFIGDSVSRDAVGHVAARAAGCSVEGQPPGEDSDCEKVIAWNRCYISSTKEVYERDGCQGKKFHRPPLVLDSLNVTFYDHWLANIKELPDQPYWQELFMDPALDQSNAVIILNTGHHELHFGVGAEDTYQSDVSDFISRLTQSCPLFEDEAVREAGVLLWRSLTPTEYPATRQNFKGISRIEDFYRAVDANVSALWRSAGFPVSDISRVAYDDRGNTQRFLTRDSLHFPRNISNTIFSFVMKDACRLLSSRRPASYEALSWTQGTGTDLKRADRQAYKGMPSTTELPLYVLLFVLLLVFHMRRRQ